MVRTIAICAIAVISYGAIHCNNLEDYKCYSVNGFCLNHLVRPCENGTICDEDWRRHHPTESPCVDPSDSYFCNHTSYRCEKGSGIQKYADCKKVFARARIRYVRIFDKFL